MTHIRFVCLFLALFIMLPPAVGAQESSCLPSRLSVGGQGIVTPGSANRIRSIPATSGEQIGQIPAGAVFDLLEGPECVEGFLWWQVDYEGTIGWTVEAGDDYFVDPFVADAATATPSAATPAPSDCALPPLLEIGREGQTTSNTPSRLRDAPDASGTQIGQIDPLAVFIIVDGPVCAAGINWWQIEMNGTTGWTAEGVEGEYFITLRAIQPTPTPEYIGFPTPQDISWNADGTQLAVATAEGLYVFSTADFSQPPARLFTDYRIYEVAFSPSDPDLVAIFRSDDENSSAVLYDLASDDVAALLSSPRPIMPARSPVFTADGSILSFSDAGGLVAVSTDPYQSEFSLSLNDYSNGELAYMGAFYTTISPDGKWMGAYDSRPLIVPVGGGNEDVIVLDRETITSSVKVLAFSPDSRSFIVGDVDANLQMWDIETLERRSFIRGGGVSISNHIIDLAFAPDGQTIVTAEGQPQAVVRVFNADTLSVQTAFSGGRRASIAYDLAFNPEGSLLAVIFDDTVRILSTTDYTQVAELVAGRP